MSNYVIVLVTTGSKIEAKNIANKLLDLKLVACANIVGPILSIFTWEGKKESSKEYMLFLKTTGAFFDEISNVIMRLHSYDVPEIVCLPIIQGLDSYLGWVKNELKII